MPPQFPRHIDRKRLLLVEGSDEDNFFSSFLNHMGSTNDVQIIKVEGVEKMRPRLELLTRDAQFSDVEKIAIVRDADLSFTSAFESVTGLLMTALSQAPARSETFTDGKPAIGVFIMPGIDRAGALERICLDALQGQPVMACVDQYLSCVQDIENTDQNLDKVRLSAYIATIPGVRLIGEAARAGSLSFQHSAYDALRQFLQELIRNET